MKTNNRHVFYVEPTHAGGSKNQVELRRENFSSEIIPNKKKKKPPSSYLLIGFDTEYQSRPPATKAEISAGARNELLSYQFCVRKIDKEASQESVVEIEGIIIPEGNERLRLEDFIAIAAGALAQKNPDVKLPQDVLLVGHFTRADFPAFDGFQESAKGFTSNIRSTFVTLDKEHLVDVVDDAGIIGSFSVALRDTILLAPANAKALADIGEIIGEQKIILHEDAKQEQHIKENMADFMRDHWPKFREYAIQDARICVEYAERIIRQSQSMFKAFSMPITLTSFGTKQVLKGWEEQAWDRNKILGREKIIEKRFSKRMGRFYKSDTAPYIEKIHFEENFVTECYHGGRNEQFVFGPAKESVWRDLDLSSAYTTAMSLIGFPDWEAMDRVETLEGVQPTDLAFFQVAFEFPKTVRFPSLPVRTSNGIIFPRKGVSFCGAPEVVTAIALGAKVDLLRGIRVPTDPKCAIFRPFISQCIQERGKHKKGTFENLFWKEVGNSTYGKTAQGLKRRRVYDLRADDMAEIGPSKITQPFFAAFITSFTRAVLGETLNALPLEASVFSVTTDGFLTNASDHHIAQALSLPMAKLFQDARKDLVGDEGALEEKHRVNQPIGWRTRGSATLKSGDSKDGIVLQKGGIRTRCERIVEAENKEIIHLFLNRKPDTTVHYTTGVGIKDMMRHGTDFVFREVEKSLGMEFDWKRRPVTPLDVEFEFDGSSYTHLGFETSPLEDVDEFNRLRDAWERYNKGERRLLRSRAEFDQFQVFIEAGKLAGKASTYVSKEDGDLKRVRRDLIRAYHSGVMGFDVLKLPPKKMKYRCFASILTEYGIPCSVSHLDNERKKSFIPHHTIATERVVRILSSLKGEHFPDLDISMFLEAEGNIKSKSSASEADRLTV